MGRRSVSVLLLGFLLAASGGSVSPAFASSRKPKPPTGKTDKGEDKPKLALTADPAFGFTPVTVIVTGALTGVDLHDRNFCHAAVTWIRIDPGQSERDGLRTREDPACVHPDEEISVSTSFTKTFVLYRPGSYLIRLEVEGKDGTRVSSGFTRVEVLRVQ
ncbi:MAG TPA: hypothetical protein VGV60_05495 [Candidatus Polarisedimenticolia bacterium]|jgi:hypothetical protein|nr:hypothetical protein [Candidatus Polarisedimenticolia bacterium]